MSSLPLPKWSILLPELLLMVVERLHIADIARVSAVCGHWAWVLGRPLRGYLPPPPNLLLHVDNSMPWMLLPNKHREEADYLSFQIINRFDKGIISFLPEMVGRRCIGSSPEGSWLVTLDLALDPRILNPLTRKEFCLPSLRTIPTDYKAIFDGSDGTVLEFIDYKNRISYPANIFRDAFIRRVIITDAPPNGVAVAFYGFHYEDACMALTRPGDPNWVPLPKVRLFGSFMDAVYRQEDQSLYVVACDGTVVIFNLTNFISSSRPTPKPKILTTSLDLQIRNIRPVIKYLVFLDGELLQIWRTLRSYTAKGIRCGNWEDEYSSPIVGIETRQIEVMRFKSGGLPTQRHDPQSCWVKVRDLGNHSLFIGCNHTLVVSVSENSELRPNCIYFTDDSHGQCDLDQQTKAWDVGVYDIKNGTIERFFPPNSDEQVIWPPPSWFMPPKLYFTLTK